MDHGRRQDERSAALWERAPGPVAYRVCRENISRLIEAHPDAEGETVPACPEWTVRDLLAHVVEGCQSRYRSLGIRSQPPRPTDGLGAAELLAEWARLAPDVEPSFTGRKGFNDDILVMDVFTHELDLRRVVGERAPDDHPAFPTALGLLLGGFTASVYAHGLPALRLETEGAHWAAGWGEPAATMRAHRLDLYRSIAGRRTHQQIAGLSWSAPAQTWLPAFTWGPFDPPAQPTEEVIGLGVAYG